MPTAIPIHRGPLSGHAHRVQLVASLAGSADRNAILVYLARKYAPAWLPADPVGEAAVQRFLSLAAGGIAYGPAAARLITVFGAELDAASVRFFVATASADAAEDTGLNGADVSHRGGRPGFVRVEGDTLTIPDLPGNLHYNTLGNILSGPRAGLTFMDDATGDLLMLTGDWAEAAATLAAEAKHDVWRPCRIARIADESAVIRSFTLEPADGGGTVASLPGQHLPIRMTPPGADAPLSRSYTLSSVLNDRAYPRELTLPMALTSKI